MKKLLVFILTLISYNSYCCDCKTISKEKEYSDADLVFLGKISYVGSSYFEVTVLEVFKGESLKKVRSFVGGCSIYPLVGDTYLLYSVQRAKNDFYISSCGYSRSFNHPFALPIPLLPPVLEQNDHGLPQSISDLYFKTALLELNLDIVRLRQIKTQNRLITIEDHYISLKKQMMFLAFGAIVLLVLFLVSKFTKSKN